MNEQPTIACPTLDGINWRNLGIEARQSAMDAHDGDLPSVHVAYSFLTDNPECFGFEEWPEDMPSEPNIEFVVGYFELNHGECC